MNIEKELASLPTPKELASELKFGFTDDQANYICADVYQPLLNLISALNDKIKRLK